MLSYPFSNHLFEVYQGIDNLIARMILDNFQPRYHRYYVIACDIPKKLFIFVGAVKSQ